jgi:hypothetical protein
MGSASVAGIIAQVVFLGVLLVGFAYGELSARRTAAFLCLWLAGLMGSSYVPYWFPFSSYVAILDMALVLMIFKGDLKLS